MTQILKPALMKQLRLDVAFELDQIGQMLGRVWGLPLPKLTLIARDPNNDNMIIVTTNEDQAGLERAGDCAADDRIVGQ